MGDATSIVRFNIVRTEADGLVQIRYGAVVIAFPAISMAPPSMRGHIAGLEADGFVQIRYGAVVIAFPAISIAPPMYTRTHSRD